MYTHVAGISKVLRMKEECIDSLVHEIKTKFDITSQLIISVNFFVLLQISEVKDCQ